MSLIPMHEMHTALGAHFTEVNGVEVVDHYDDVSAEHLALRESAGVCDLSFRGRLCLTGADRVRLLHGQVTNDVQGLGYGAGCYAALVNNKGRMQGDVFIHALKQELLLDFEPGLTPFFIKRFDHYIVADDVQVVDAAPYYGLLSVQGPRAGEVMNTLEIGGALPQTPLHFTQLELPGVGGVYLMNQPRLGRPGFELFVPTGSLGSVCDRLMAAARERGGRLVGWQAWELARVEAGIPRFGADMDDSNLPPEAGIAPRAVSYEKGCYIGQEVLARLRTYGQVTKALRGMRIAPGDVLPVRGDKLWREGREVGYLTSVRDAPGNGVIALGYVRRECFQPGTELMVRSAGGTSTAQIVDLPIVG